jgi:hypothetical protein
LNPFSDIQASVRGLRDDGFEHRKVEYTLQQLQQYRILKQLRQLTEQGHMTFDLLRSHLALPFWIGCTTLPKLGCALHMSPKAILPVWFSRFGSLPICRPFRDLHAQAAQSSPGLPVALIFPRKGLRQGLVIHNGGFNQLALSSSAMLYRDSELGELVVQSYATFVAQLKEPRA